MNILWLSWKDIMNPYAGGAEIVTSELLKRLAQDGHKVVLVTSRFKHSEMEEDRDGYQIRRVGSRISVYWKAYQYYRLNLKNWADLVIDECNTIPFFAIRYVNCQSIMFFHQLCREIWFYQIFWPLSWIGYLIEPLYLRWLNHARAITVSQSTSNDLQRYGFKKENIKIISEGIQIKPVIALGNVKKYERPTVLSLGSVRPMKRTIDVLRAFEQAKSKIPDLYLIIAGPLKGAYGEKIKGAVKASIFSQSIELVGPVNDQKKIDFLQSSHLVVVTSVKEGWCLVVTEANSQGTPAIAYNTDGLRDSIRNLETGWLTKHNTPTSLAITIRDALSNEQIYKKVQYHGWLWSKEINFSKSYNDFLKIIT